MKTAAEVIAQIGCHEKWDWVTPEDKVVIMGALFKQVETNTVPTEESFGPDCCPHCHWPLRWIQEEFLSISYCPYCGQKVHVTEVEK